MSAAEPVQEFFSIGEVCELTDLKPHVLRYWETQFRFLNPAKNATIGVRPQRVFSMLHSDFTGSPTRWVFDEDR